MVEIKVVTDATLGVSEQRPAGEPIPADPPVDLYMVRTRRHRPAIFLPRRSLELCNAGDGVRIRRFIRRLMRSRNRVVRWVGRVTRSGHRSYQKLEDRIDPLERMIKAFNAPRRFEVRHAPVADPLGLFRDLVRGQLAKHTAWLMVDCAVTIVVVALAPVLVPIPGPNVFFYYPALRLLSHYRARTGAQRALNGNCISFEEFHQLSCLEEELLSRGGSDGNEGSSRLHVEGLEEFLRKVG